jgi:hypothetical protein
MKAYTKITALALSILSLMTACKEPQPEVIEEEKYTNEITYNGETFAIGSVVRFEQDNNTVQFWISRQEGLTSVDQIEETDGYLIVSTHKSFLGGRDRFSKNGSFVKYGDLQFATGDEGMGFIEASITGEELTLDFAIENLHSKATDAALQGNYKGGFSSYTEPALNNEWMKGRNRQNISGSKLTVREDGGADIYALYNTDGTVAIEFSLPQSRRGLPTLLTLSETPVSGIEITYDNGKTADLSKTYGTITANFNSEEVAVSFDVTVESERIRAEFQGPYALEITKTNRYIYNSGYPSGSGYDGAFFLEKLNVSEYNDVLTFELLPYDTDSRFSDVPELKISDLSLIGKTDIDMRNTPGWHFEFDKIVVDAYENEWKPAPIAGSKLTIIQTADGYLIDMELATEEPTFKYISSIDLHYEGPAVVK